MDYNEVQFIAYCINTAPKMTADQKKEYLGLTNSQADIDARIELVKKAIEQARSRADSSSTTLKIFMLPEFFFRGKAGAYEIKDVLGEVSAEAIYVKNENGEEIKKIVAGPEPKKAGIIDKLQKLVEEKIWENWLFVFGTIVGKSELTEAELLIENKLNLSNQENKIKKEKDELEKKMKASSEEQDKNKLEELSNRENKIKKEKGKLEEKMKVFSEEEKNSLGGLEIYNFVLVQKGGFLNISKASSHAKVIVKKEKSSIDFIEFKDLANKTYRDDKLKKRVEAGNWVRHLEPAPSSGSGYTPDEEYNYDDSVFEFGGITFGLEICLDHSEKRLKQRIDKTRESIHIQLIPSCGMQIEPEAVVIKEGGYVFNCDGLSGGWYSINLQLKNILNYENDTTTMMRWRGGMPSCERVDGEIVRGSSHSNLAKRVGNTPDLPNLGNINVLNPKVFPPIGSSPGRLAAADSLTSSGFRFFEFIELPSTLLIDINDPHIDEIYAQGAGQLHVYPSQPLSSLAKAVQPSQNASQLQLSAANSLSLFPSTESNFITALSNEPVLLNGMKVIFDQFSPVYPVTLEPKNK